MVDVFANRPQMFSVNSLTFQILCGKPITFPPSLSTLSIHTLSTMMQSF